MWEAFLNHKELNLTIRTIEKLTKIGSWKYIDDEGLEAGVKYLEEENSTQTPAEYSIMEFYREQLARLKISGSRSGISSIERRS